MDSNQKWINYAEYILVEEFEKLLSKKEEIDYLKDLFASYPKGLKNGSQDSRIEQEEKELKNIEENVIKYQKQLKSEEVR